MPVCDIAGQPGGEEHMQTIMMRAALAVAAVTAVAVVTAGGPVEAAQPVATTASESGSRPVITLDSGEKIRSGGDRWVWYDPDDDSQRELVQHDATAYFGPCGEPGQAQSADGLVRGEIIPPSGDRTYTAWYEPARNKVPSDCGFEGDIFDRQGTITGASGTPERPDDSPPTFVANPSRGQVYCADGQWESSDVAARSRVDEAGAFGEVYEDQWQPSPGAPGHMEAFKDVFPRHVDEVAPHGLNDCIPPPGSHYVATGDSDGSVHWPLFVIDSDKEENHTLLRHRDRDRGPVYMDSKGGRKAFYGPCGEPGGAVHALNDEGGSLDGWTSEMTDRITAHMRDEERETAPAAEDDPRNEGRRIWAQPEPDGNKPGWTIMSYRPADIDGIDCALDGNGQPPEPPGGDPAPEEPGPPGTEGAPKGTMLNGHVFPASNDYRTVHASWNDIDVVSDPITPEAVAVVLDGAAAGVIGGARAPSEFNVDIVEVLCSTVVCDPERLEVVGLAAELVVDAPEGFEEGEHYEIVQADMTLDNPTATLHFFDATRPDEPFKVSVRGSGTVEVTDYTVGRSWQTVSYGSPTTGPVGATVDEDLTGPVEGQQTHTVTVELSSDRVRLPVLSAATSG